MLLWPNLGAYIIMCQCNSYMYRYSMPLTKEKVPVLYISSELSIPSNVRYLEGRFIHQINIYCATISACSQVPSAFML